MEDNESRKQTSRSTRGSHITNSELLEDAETYEQTQPRSGESKREAELLSDEQVQQQEDEIRGPLVVPTVSNRKRWAGFDVDGHEPRGGSMGNAEPSFEDPTAKYRNDREDMLTPDEITYSTSLNSEDGDSDNDDAVLRPKASGIAIPSSPPRGHRGQFISHSEEQIASVTSFQNKVAQALTVDELEYFAGNGRAEKITRLAAILETKRRRTNQHELAHASEARQSQPGTVPVATAFQGQATDMLHDSPKLSQYVRENRL